MTLTKATLLGGTFVAMTTTFAPTSAQAGDVKIMSGGACTHVNGYKNISDGSMHN